MRPFPESARRVLAEGLGTAGLVAVVVGSGIAAERLSPGEPGLQLLQNSTATVFGLLALLLALGGVSGAHFNPVVTAVDAVRGRIGLRLALGYVVAQTAGGALGALLANAMFERPVFETALRVRGGAPLWLAEAVATAGLLVTIHGTASTKPTSTPLAVAGYIGAAYWFTSSTSFANPAVTIARSLSDSFAGIAPGSVPGFVAAQLAGAAGAFLLLALLLPGWSGRAAPAPERRS